jgi:signal peptidase I
MEPEIKTGSMVVVKTASNYNLNDVITYYDRTDSKKTVTHRIVDKKTTGSIEQIITKGDANGSNDSIAITKDQIIGKVHFSIRYLGYLVGAAKTTVGFIILIVIPATIIIYEEIKKIHHETKHIIKRRRERKLNKELDKNKNNLENEKMVDNIKGENNETS